MNQWIKEVSDEDLYASKMHNELGAGERVEPN